MLAYTLWSKAEDVSFDPVGISELGNSLAARNIATRPKVEILF